MSQEPLFLVTTGTGALGDADGTQGASVRYWEAGKMQAPMGLRERLFGSAEYERKKEEPERMYTRTLP